MKEQEAAENIKLTGIAVSPGIVIGKARLVDRSKQKIIYQYLINENEIQREVERFQKAYEIAAAAEQLGKEGKVRTRIRFFRVRV